MNIINKDTRKVEKFVVGAQVGTVGYQPLTVINVNCKYAFVELWVITDVNTAQQVALNNSIGNISANSTASQGISGSSTGIISGFVTPGTSIGGNATSGTAHRKYLRVTEYY